MPHNTDIVEAEKLAPLVTRAATKLAEATTAAEVLDAMRDARAGYDIAKAAARLARAKGARDEVLATCRQTMADLLVIESQAECRIADEYDAAQERGEVQTPGGDRRSINVAHENNGPPTVDEDRKSVV